MRVALVLALGILSACALRREEPALAQGAGRAALATVTLENRTARPLNVVYRLAVGPTGEIGIGVVEPGATLRLAPVPAAEPIILTVRDPAGASLTLPPRTFELGADWRWVVPAQARFQAPAES